LFPHARRTGSLVLLCFLGVFPAFFFILCVVCVSSV
jgi:hypothetical protein